VNQIQIASTFCDQIQGNGTHVLTNPWKLVKTAASSLSPNFHQVQIEDDLDTTSPASE
jgi:hypothetical protein